MKYGILFRKLIIDGVPYYQGFTKIVGEQVENNKIKIIEGKYEGKVVGVLETMKNMVYMEIDKNQYDSIEEAQTYIKVVDNDFSGLDDFDEVATVSKVFYDKYHDFNLVPNYDIDELILDVKNDLKNKLIGEDKPIDKILTKIYNNQMYFNSDLSEDYLRKVKSNILVLGPEGTGKTTIKESLMNNLDPIPVIECTLTGNFGIDAGSILTKLMASANGNKFLAQRGIVIFDGLNEYTASTHDEEEGKLKYYLDTFEEIMEANRVYFPRNNKPPIEFDFSLLTFICMTDIDYDFEEDDELEDEDNYLYYTKIKDSKLYELGFSGEMINSCFDEEVIFMESMTKELALKILKNKKMSPVYKLQKVREKNNKKLEIKEGFLEELAEYGLKTNEGFTGILKIFKYLLESKGYKQETIVLDPDELHDLQIGSFIIDDEEEDEEEEIVDNQKKSSKTKDGFDVDLVKRTINGLTLKDTIDIIKKSVKGQDKAIFSITNSFYNHVFNRYRGYTKQELRELKENVLVFGSTGVGKTAIVLCLSNIFDIPFVREVATRYSKAGFVGESVDSILYDLVSAAKGDVKKAQNGILYIDEIDKIKASKSESDSMAQGVQYDLLTLIEGDKRKVEGNILRSGLEFDTSNLWVIGTGAFDGIDDFIKARLKKENNVGKIGFGETQTLDKKLPTPTDDDLYNYGLDRQFAGRFPHKVHLNDMDGDILYDIINNSDGGYVNLVKKGYMGDGILLSMTDGFKKNLALKALAKKQGARGIHSAFMPIKEIIDENIQNGDIEEVILDDECVNNLDKIQYVKRKK